MNPKGPFRLSAASAPARADFIPAPCRTGFNITAAPIHGLFGNPMITVLAITDKADMPTARHPNFFLTPGSTTAPAVRMRDIPVDQRDAGSIGNRMAVGNDADACGIEMMNGSMK